MTHDDLIAVLLLLGVRPVDVAAESGLNASSIFVVLLENSGEVERHGHVTGVVRTPQTEQTMMLLA